MTSDLHYYDIDYISGVMSLRKPQKESLVRLDTVLNTVRLSKSANLAASLASVHALYKTCTDFERDFMSLTFALATGVGKTRLMGAFITYLYARHGIRNFFVVAPGTTVYEKLKQDLGNPASEKYVFKGIGCFAALPPRIIADDDYRNKPLELFAADVNIYIFNIDKFNKEDSKMRSVNEYLGNVFMSTLPR